MFDLPRGQLLSFALTFDAGRGASQRDLGALIRIWFGLQKVPKKYIWGISNSSFVGDREHHPRSPHSFSQHAGHGFLHVPHLRSHDGATT